MMQVLEMLHSDVGSALISILLGLGLAALFRKACKDNRCIVVKGPPIRDTQAYTYKIDDQCYQYVPVVTDCSFKPTT
jgi:hypothetical protein